MPTLVKFKKTRTEVCVNQVNARDVRQIRVPVANEMIKVAGEDSEVRISPIIFGKHPKRLMRTVALKCWSISNLVLRHY